MSRFPKIGSRVAEYGAYTGILTLGAFGYAKYYGKSEDQKHEELQKKYPDLVLQSQGSKKAMQSFFDKMKNDSNDPTNQKKFDELLRAGKGKMKRQGANVGIEETIKPVKKPEVIPLREKKQNIKEKENKGKKIESDEKKGWFW